MSDIIKDVDDAVSDIATILSDDDKTTDVLESPEIVLATSDDTKEEAKDTEESSEDTEDVSDFGENIRQANFLQSIINKAPAPPQVEDIVEGPVVEIGKTAIHIDMGVYGIGIIYGKEFSNARDIINKINIGDSITAKVVDAENENGYIELSLKEARQALIWNEAEEAVKNKTVIELPIKDANKGGLILEWQGIQGFLPASQLKTEHYPRVEDGNKDKILEELRKLIDERIAVSIISVSPKENKLIFSEKETDNKEKEEMIGKYQIGDVLEGEVTGTVDFGVFIKIEDGLEGLVHISEMDWALVENPKSMFKPGEHIKVKVIDIKDGKISLSIKALKDNPWVKAKDTYKKDTKVSGVVIKYNPHGALVSIEEGVAGLVHISEFGSDDKLRETLELGKTYDFVITLFEPEEQRMTLSWKEANKPEAEKKAEKEETRSTPLTAGKDKGEEKTEEKEDK